MDRQYIRDNDVIERYLKGALTAEEEADFEETYLGDPELVSEIEAAERLRDGIKGLDGAGNLGGSRRGWGQAFASPRYAMAATVLLAVSLGFSSMLYNENQLLRESASSTQLSTRFVTLEARRGGNAAEIEAPAQDESIVLLLDAGVVAYDTYRAVITRRDSDRSEQIWSRSDLTPQLNGTAIAVSLQRRVLPPGRYEAEVAGRMNDWAAERFEQVAAISFVVVARE